MELLDLITDFHKDAQRQGPGSEQETMRALSFVNGLNEDSRILDIGCGTGAQTMTLAAHAAGRITAVDVLQVFLDKLDQKIRDRNLEQRVMTERVSMAELPYPDNEFDLIWAEGSIYHIGFAKGLREWRRLLKPGGHMVISEISWLTDSRPQELHDYWTGEYPEIDTIAAKIGVIERVGYLPLAHFVLPEYCWTENYYHPILDRSEAFLQKYDYDQTVQAFVAAGRREAVVYERYKDYYSYVFYISKQCLRSGSPC